MAEALLTKKGVVFICDCGLTHTINETETEGELSVSTKYKKQDLPEKKEPETTTKNEGKKSNEQDKKDSGRRGLFGRG